jgi:hypothetical protein
MTWQAIITPYPTGRGNNAAYHLENLMLIKHGDDQPILKVIKTAEDLDTEKELAKRSKADMDEQTKTAKEAN